MDFLKSNRRFDFIYNGKNIDECSYTLNVTQNGDTLVSEYLFCDGLKVTNVAKVYPSYGAYEWVNYFENTSESESGIISNLLDCDCQFEIGKGQYQKHEAYIPPIETATRVFSPMGSTWDANEFGCDADVYFSNKRTNHLYIGETLSYSASGGRSCENKAPFFDIHCNGKGVIFAIGWSGQWKCSLTGTENGFILRSGLEDTNFKLMPKEKIRTSSVVILPYEASLTDAHNKWRRLIKEHFSLVTDPARGGQGPFCASVWGGMNTSSVLERIETICKNKLPFDYIWMDAGWYGNSLPTPDEFEGDWWGRAGDWTVSPYIHPNLLKDVAQKTHEAGMKFLLWFEIERAVCTTPVAKAHPEYFFKMEDSNTYLLNLGDASGWKYAFDTLANAIEEIGIDCYRQDFNISPLPYWRANDAEDRKGISEIKHIMGLYDLWDKLLEKFPTLLIDNCASGGRRIDIETLRRSIPLWRTDYMCPANFDSYASQMHHINFNTWLPFSGTGVGRIYDTYRMRSAYSAAINANFAFSERESFGDDEEKMEWLKRICDEYLEIRPYFSEDFYPLTQPSDKTDIWSAVQFDRPSHKDGVVQVFRREGSPYERASFTLGAIDKNATYTFSDRDSGEKLVISGSELYDDGFTVTLKEKRCAKIYFYKHE